MGAVAACATSGGSPYDEVLGKAIRASARMLYGRDGQRAEALREGALPLLRVAGRSLRRSQGVRLRYGLMLPNDGRTCV